MAVQRCARCGTARRADLQVCLRCETPYADPAPPGDVAADLDIDATRPRPAAPSSTQSHGTVFLGVLVGFVLLAVLLRLSIAGVGPFRVQIVESRSVGTQLEVTLRITNDGDRAGRANCRIPLADEADVVQPPHTLLTQRIDPDETVTQVLTVTVREGVRPSGPVSC